MSKLLYGLLICQIITAQIAVPSNGKLIRHVDFPSAYITPRHVDVWLPEDYNGKIKYSVLYMHDGQMLFDPSHTWNKQEWGVDEAAGRMMAFKRSTNFIVVGIHNIARERHANYFPQKPFETLPPTVQDSVYESFRYDEVKFFNQPINSDDYLKFIVKELKPFIDKTYAVKTDAPSTFIGGSSMGGLISWYAVCEYPEVFGGSFSLSTHWIGTKESANNPLPAVFFDYLKDKLPMPKKHKFYFDHGTKTIDAFYGEYQNEVNQIFKTKGYTDKHLSSRVFHNADHTENAWAFRLHIPLMFLFGK